jgi:hypothetical protein
MAITFTKNGHAFGAAYTFSVENFKSQVPGNLYPAVSLGYTGQKIQVNLQAPFVYKEANPVSESPGQHLR